MNEIQIREAMADDLARVAFSLQNISSLWTANDLPSDFLAEEEYPFKQELDELIAEVNHAVDLIRQVNFLGVDEVVLKLSPQDFIAMTEELASPPRPLPKLQALFQQHPLWGEHQ